MRAMASFMASDGVRYACYEMDVQDLVVDLMTFEEYGVELWRRTDIRLPAVESLPTVAAAIREAPHPDVRFQVIEDAIEAACRALPTQFSTASLAQFGFTERTRGLKKTPRRRAAAQSFPMDLRTYLRSPNTMAQGQASWMALVVARVADALFSPTIPEAPTTGLSSESSARDDDEPLSSSEPVVMPVSPRRSSSARLPRLALLCAVPTEHAVIRRFCTDLKWDNQLQCERGVLTSGPYAWDVAVHATGQTNSAAGAATAAILRSFRPALAIFVGIAGGFGEKGLDHLDVVAVASVHLYRSGAAHDLPRSRPRSRNSDQQILDRIALLAQAEPLADINVHIGDVVSGDELLRSLKSETYKLIRKRYDQALAIEMEGHGFLEAAGRERVPAVVLRGISDLLTDKSLTTDSAHQPAATTNAMQLAMALLGTYGSSLAGSSEVGIVPSTHGRTREALLLQLGGADDDAAAEAAAVILDDALRASTARPVLILTTRAVDGAVEIVCGERAARVSLESVRLWAREGFEYLANRSIAELFGTELAAPDKPEETIEVMRSPSVVDATRTPRVDRITESLRRHPHVALVGASGSGKTIAAAQALETLQTLGWRSTWLDLGNPGLQTHSVLLDLARTEARDGADQIVVLDDFQCNPGLGGKLLDLLADASGGTSKGLRLLVLSWESGVVVAQDRIDDLVRINCFGEEVIPALAAEFLPEQDEAVVVPLLRQLSRGDLLIARLACEIWSKTGEEPDREALSAAAYEAVAGGAMLSATDDRLLYLVASLGQFEVEPTLAYVETFEPSALTRLLDLGAIRRNGDYLSVGHRTLASLLCGHIQRAQPGLEVPLRLTVGYLQAAGDDQTIAMLERLDLAELAEREIDQHGGAFLARAWDSVRTLEKELSHQVDLDVTWGDNLASAVFAAHALGGFHREQWKRTAEFIRARWDYADGHSLPSPIGHATAERIDFDEIAIKMKEEEEIVSWPVADQIDRIDLDRCHKTWALGLLLGFEGAAPDRDPKRLTILKEAARVAQEPDGNFYPRRVPWVTARVVIGLTLAGETTLSSDTVRSACAWLRRRHPVGPYELGSWPSGTGKWNTRTMTTAMCLTALIYAGVSLDDPAVRGGVAYLRSQQGEWLAAGQEIDAVDAMETLILTGTRWREIQSQLLQVVAWARDRDAWRHASDSASESQDESSKVPAVANSLTALMWATVKSELPLLLEGLSVDTTA